MGDKTRVKQWLCSSLVTRHQELPSLTVGLLIPYAPGSSGEAVMTKHFGRIYLVLILMMAALTAFGQQGQPDEFVSVLGRFGITMPAPYVEYRPFIELRTTAGQKFSTATYRWILDSDQVVVSYGAGSINLEDPKQRDTFLTGMKNEYVAKAGHGSLLAEKPTTLGGHPGIVFGLDSDGGRVIVWIYAVKNRFYVLSLSVNEPEKKDAHVKTVTTFRFLSSEDLEPRYKQLVEQLTPLPLTEPPLSKRLANDLQDVRLNGQVKAVITEEEKFEGTELFDDRARTSVDYYDETGNLTKSEQYSGGLPQAVRMYGYVKGDRAYREMRRLPDLILKTNDPKKKDNVTKQPTEIKIFKIKYKYSGNQLLEIQVNREDGEEFEKYVFTPKDNRVEHTFDRAYIMFFLRDTIFAKDKVISQLDDKGIALEDTVMTPSGRTDDASQAIPGAGYVNIYKQRYDSQKIKYSYEFDQQGNWIKRTAIVVTKDKGDVADHVTYRKITYYP
jgi:hypothetical protein